MWLEDLNYHERRHFNLGLPEALEFNLKRNAGSDVKLSLRENRRLNANAHVFETVSEDGIMRAVRKTSASTLVSRLSKVIFYISWPLHSYNLKDLKRHNFRMRHVYHKRILKKSILASFLKN